MSNETPPDGVGRAKPADAHLAADGMIGATDAMPPQSTSTRTNAGVVEASAAFVPASGDHRRLLLKAAAYLLGYPSDEFGTTLDEMRLDLERMGEGTATQLVAAMATLRLIPPTMLAASYVASFDFSDARSLYLTAHELGDSRRRGQALLDLRALLRASGFELPNGELPDYLPALLEFVACAPPDTDTTTLERRLAVVCDQIHAELAAEDPYRPVLATLCALLPAIEPAEATAAGASSRPASQRQRFPLHERADTDELPYPLRYE